MAHVKTPVMCRFLPPRQANDSTSMTSQSMGTEAHGGGLDGCKDAVKYLVTPPRLGVGLVLR